MPETEDSHALATWSVPECPFTIEYSLQALDDVRMAVVDAFFSLPRGGAEIGGILCGKWDGQKLSITGYAPLDCEHAFGPSFTLSPRDEILLTDLVSADCGQGVRPVGWYHSHTRSEIFLSDADQEVHRRFFPEPWQVAVVLKPHTFHPTRAGFFFRGASGNIHAEASYQEIILDPLKVRQVPAGLPASLDPEPAPLLPAPPVPPPLPVSPPPPEPPVLMSMPQPAPPVPVSAPVPDPVVLPIALRPEAEPQPAREAVTASVEADPEAPRPEAPVRPEPRFEEPMPSFLDAEKPGRPRRWLLVAMWLMAGFALGAAAYWKRDAWWPRLSAVTQSKPQKQGVAVPAEKPKADSALVSPSSPPYVPLGLNTLDQDGQLQIRWNASSPVVQQATGAILGINAGTPSAHEIPLDKAHLLSGVFTYARQTEQVDVSLALTEPGGKASREVTTFMGKLPEKQAAAEAPGAKLERERLAKQVAKVQADLAAEIVSNAKLRKNVDTLTKQLRDQQRSRLLNQIPK